MAFTERARGKRAAGAAVPAAVLAVVMAGCGSTPASTAGGSPTSAPAPPPHWSELGGSLSPLSGHAAAGVAVWGPSVVALLESRVRRYQSGGWSAMPALPSPTSNLDPADLAVAGSELWVGAYGFSQYDSATGAWAVRDPASAIPITGNMAANASGVVVALPDGMGSPWEWSGRGWAQLSGLSSALSGGFTYAAAVASGGAVLVGTSSGVWEGGAGSAWSQLGGGANALATHRVTRIAVSSGQIAVYGPGVGVVEYIGGAWNTPGGEPAGVRPASADTLSGLLGGSDPLVFSPAGALTIGTSSGVIWTYAAGTWSAIAHLGAAIEGLAYAPNGTLVASTAGGVYADGGI